MRPKNNRNCWPFVAAAVALLTWTGCERLGSHPHDHSDGGHSHEAEASSVAEPAGEVQPDEHAKHDESGHGHSHEADASSAAKPAGEVRPDEHAEHSEDSHGHSHDSTAEHDDHGHAHAETDNDGAARPDEPEPVGRVIAVPPATRQNLSITFVKVEDRPVRGTIRLPGKFELQPKARREYNVMLSGRVRLAVEQYQTVAPGDVLFELDSPEWRRVQSKLAEAFKACYCCLPELDAAKAAEHENQAQVEFLSKRMERLTSAGSRDVQLEADMSKLETQAPRLEAEVRAKKADMQSALLAYNVLLTEAESLSGVSRSQLELLDGKRPEQLNENEEDDSLPTPFWSTVDRIVVRAEVAGIANRIEVTHQGWAETGDLVVETIDPSMIRFHADALQTDLVRFDDGMPAQIVPPPGGSIDLQDTIKGRIVVGFQAHLEQNTVPIYLIPDRMPRWVKAGVTAYLEVFVDGESESSPAVPAAAIVRDGLDKVLFLRDRHNPDQVIRIAAELGANDGRWVEIKRGVRPGDEVVLGGVYPLMLASSGSGEIQSGGHFHADGAFHEGDEH